MEPHAVFVDGWFRALSRRGRVRAGLAALLAVALGMLLVGAVEDPPEPSSPHVQQDPVVGPPELDGHDVVLGLRPLLAAPGPAGHPAAVVAARPERRPSAS